MAVLTIEQITELQNLKTDYQISGFSKQLHKPIFRPKFFATDEPNQLIPSISGSLLGGQSVALSKIKLTDFVKLTSVATIAATTVANGASATVVMTLTLNTDRFTLAIPRWSLYDGAVSPANEIVAASNDWREINVVRSWEATRGTGGSSNFKHILKINIANTSGGDKTLNFRGDWLFLGDLVGSAA